MSGFASNIEYIDSGVVITSNDEAAGYIWGAVVVIAKAIAPVLVAAAKGALIGSVVSAGIAYAGGARGSDVWKAAGMGALGGAVTGGLGSLASPAAGAAGGSAGSTGTAALSGSPGIAAGSTVPGVSGSVITGSTVGAASPTLMSSITSMFGSVSKETMSRISAAVINAAVNGQNMGSMNSLVEQQRAELQALAGRDRAAYEMRINLAQQTIAEADRADPDWWARARMADATGIHYTEFRQAMRNIATRQGGSLDAGQRNAYERGSAIELARTKALVYNQGFTQAQGMQAQLRAQAAGMLGPDEAGFRSWQAETGLLADQERARAERNESTWGGFSAAFTEPNYRPSTSPDPSSDDDDDEQTGLSGGYNSFFGGRT